MSREAEIHLTVQLNEDNIPVSITWGATDAPFEGNKPCTGMMLSIWDKEKKGTLNIDLWTQDLTVDEMGVYCYESLIKMAETYERATSDKDIGGMIRSFAEQFGLKVKELAERRQP